MTGFDRDAARDGEEWKGQTAYLKGYADGLLEGLARAEKHVLKGLRKAMSDDRF